MAHERVGYDIGFTLSLGQSWTLATAAIALAYWSDDRSWSSVRDWGLLWLFTVVAPTIQAMKVHRRLRELAGACPEMPARALRDLKEARLALPLLGSLAVLAAFGLGLGR
jgi:hypothetical protein